MVRGGSRGQKKPSLRDLSRQMPTDDEFLRIMTDIEHMDNRAAALVLASLIDNLLEFAIKFRFVPLKGDDFDKLFRNPTAPLASFSAKITLAHALGLCDEVMRRQLDIMRSVRNAFAHTIMPVTFDDPLIAAECYRLDPVRLIDIPYQPVEDSPKGRFLYVGRVIAFQLIGIIQRLSEISTLPQSSPDKSAPHHPHSSESQD